MLRAMPLKALLGLRPPSCCLSPQRHGVRLWVLWAGSSQQARAPTGWAGHVLPLPELS